MKEQSNLENGKCGTIYSSNGRFSWQTNVVETPGIN